MLLYTQSIREIKKINNQLKTQRNILNSVKYVDSVNGRRIIFKIYHIVKRDCRIFGIKEKTGFAGPKRMTAVEIPLQKIFIVKVVKSLFQR